MSQIRLQDKLQTENVSGLSLEEYSKWMCLVEALNIIVLKAEQLNQDLDGSTDWIKPIALQKYIKERYPSMKSFISNKISSEA